MAEFNPDSILDTVKAYLGVEPDVLSFDQDILMAINSALMTLDQVGIRCHAIANNMDTWSAVFPDTGVNIGGVRSYVYLRARLIFDPPATSFALSAFQEQIKELEWRLQAKSEETPPAQPIVN